MTLVAVRDACQLTACKRRRRGQPSSGRVLLREPKRPGGPEGRLLPKPKVDDHRTCEHADVVVEAREHESSPYVSPAARRIDDVSRRRGVDLEGVAARACVALRLAVGEVRAGKRAVTPRPRDDANAGQLMTLIRGAKPVDRMRRRPQAIEVLVRGPRQWINVVRQRSTSADDRHEHKGNCRPMPHLPSMSRSGRSVRQARRLPRRLVPVAGSRMRASPRSSVGWPTVRSAASVRISGMAAAAAE
jgi:hypothetical protein